MGSVYLLHRNWHEIQLHAVRHEELTGAAGGQKWDDERNVGG
jgi:hypothetical protein